MTTIEVIGIGLDGTAGLSENVRQLIENATILVGSDRHLSYFPTHPAKKIVLGNFLEAIEFIKQNFKENIVILVTGDPLFFGLGRLLLEKFPSEKLRFHPHLTSVQLAFNRIKVPWQDAKIISVHGRNLDELMPLLQQGVEKIAILTDNENHPGAIARFYQELDLPTYYDFWVCENLGDSNEKVAHFSAVEIDRVVSLSNQDFASLNVVILLRQEKEELFNLNTLPLFGLPDSAFLSFRDRPGLMTKREIRLIVLGEFALTTQQIIWDIGAGTGSVSIEIARLCPTSKIYAIEKTAIGINLIEKNCQRFQVNNVIPVSGNAPDSLTKLPNPNRIFVGGSGGNLSKILEVGQEKLQVDGILVLALATLENLNECLGWLSEHNWNYRLLQVQISRSVSIGKMTRFSPLNPVTIVTATRQ
jgi:precorrin-6B C5,15-methyltransferase / cobalt-precorrin-6B C5,C15-methyltransferase